MVKGLTKDDELALGKAIAQAAHVTSAKIRVVVKASSSHYRDFALLYGFLLGSAVSLALWVGGVVRFPILLGVQVAIIAIIDLVPWLRLVCIRLVPKRLRHYHGAEAAHREYLAVHADMPKEEPFVLLIVSLAERYVHIVTNPMVHMRIPGDWNQITGQFIKDVRIAGLRETCTEAVGQIAAMLSGQFFVK